VVIRRWRALLVHGSRFEPGRATGTSAKSIGGNRHSTGTPGEEDRSAIRAPHLSWSSYHHVLLLRRITVIGRETLGIGFAETQHDPVTQDILNLIRRYVLARGADTKKTAHIEEDIA
jgi:hypothetical protein